MMSSGKPLPVPNQNSDTEQAVALFNYAVISPDGVIFQDTSLQVGVQSHFFKHQGRLVLYYGNFTTGPISDFSTQISPTPALQINLQNPPLMIEPKKQEMQVIDMTCLSEFIDPPVLNLSYSVNGRRFSQAIKLPVVSVKFIQPNRASESEFLKMWPELKAEVQQVVDTNAPANVPYCIQLFTEGFHLGVIPGTSWSQNNVVGSGNLFTATKHLPCLVRMEISPTTTLYRITVRSDTPTLSMSLLNTFVATLGLPKQL